MVYEIKLAIGVQKQLKKASFCITHPTSGALPHRMFKVYMGPHNNLPNS